MDDLVLFIGGIVIGFCLSILTTTIDRKTLEAKLRKKWNVKL